MKKIFLISLILFSFITLAIAKEPNFKVHKLGMITQNQMGGETRIPAILDYDNDGDQDVIIIDKHGMVFILENLLIE